MYFCLPLPVARLGILMYFVVVDRPILNTLTGVIEGEFNPGSLTQTVDLTPPGKNDAETVSDGCDQYIFVRYYTMHKRPGIPRVVNAGAGPHNLGSGVCEDVDESSPKVEARSPADSGSDSMSNTCDDGGGKDRSSVTSVEPGSETVIHNTAADEKDGFDAIADYVLQNSDADSVLIHHQDAALLRERQKSITQRTSGSADFGFSFGRSDADRPSSVAAAGGTSSRDSQRNDANYTLRAEDWTFGKEKADGSGPGLSGLTAGDVAAPTVGSGSSELWRCHVAGRFSVERFALLSDSPKPPQHRMYIKHIPDPYSMNRRGGPGVIVHKHSQARAFSILRSHGLFRPKQNKKPGQVDRHPDSSQSILLATKSVQKQYTNTKTTGRLKTYGLLEERPTSTPPRPRPGEESPDGGSQRSVLVAPIRRPRSHSLVRKDEGGCDEGKVKDSRKEEKGKEKEKDCAGSQMNTREDITVITRNNEFWSKLPGRHAPTHSTADPSPRIPENSVTTSTPSFRPLSPSRATSSSHSYRISRPEIGDGEDEEAGEDDFDWYRVPVQKRTHAEIYASLTPAHHEQARNLIRSSRSSLMGSSRGIFTKFFPRKGGNPSDWLRNSPTTGLAPSPVPWMLTENSNVGFDAVGPVPPRPPPGGKGSDGLSLPVPDDSVYMLLPLFAGETDSEFQPEDMTRYEVPLESRKYLLVYYVPFDEQTGRAGGKKIEQPIASQSSQRAKSWTVLLKSFRVSAHLMSYQDLKGSGIRIPATGLSVTGPLTYAQPPDVEPKLHRDSIAIAQCLKRGNGIEFFPEGLHKLGLCDAERVKQTDHPDGFGDEDRKVEHKFELNALGRAAVEMAWVGAMAVTSFGTA